MKITGRIFLIFCFGNSHQEISSSRTNFSKFNNWTLNRHTRKFKDYKSEPSIWSSIQYFCLIFHRVDAAMMNKKVIYITWSCLQKFLRARKMLFLAFISIYLLKCWLCSFFALENIHQINKSTFTNKLSSLYFLKVDNINQNGAPEHTDQIRDCPYQTWTILCWILEKI